MNTVLIQSAIPCNAAFIPLSAHPTIFNAFQITINPKPIGTTGPLVLQVVCLLLPGPTGQVNYRLTLQSIADWQFTGPNPTQLTFNRNTSSGSIESLPFELSNLTPSGSTFPAVMLLEACDPTVPPPNTDQKTVTLAE